MIRGRQWSTFPWMLWKVKVTFPQCVFSDCLPFEHVPLDALKGRRVPHHKFVAALVAHLSSSSSRSVFWSEWVSVSQWLLIVLLFFPHIRSAGRQGLVSDLYELQLLWIQVSDADQHCPLRSWLFPLRLAVEPVPEIAKPQSAKLMFCSHQSRAKDQVALGRKSQRFSTRFQPKSSELAVTGRVPVPELEMFWVWDFSGELGGVGGTGGRSALMLPPFEAASPPSFTLVGGRGRRLLTGRGCTGGASPRCAGLSRCTCFDCVYQVARCTYENLSRCTFDYIHQGALLKVYQCALLWSRPNLNM